MVQPYIAGIERQGEFNLVFIGGRYSHAFRKGAMLSSGPKAERSLFLEENIGRHEATAEQRTLAERALRAIPGGSERLLYARVDLLPTVDGDLLVSEVELIEPALHLDHTPGAAERLVGLILESTI